MIKFQLSAFSIIFLVFPVYAKNSVKAGTHLRRGRQDRRRLDDLFGFLPDDFELFPEDFEFLPEDF